jgi:hypothetical protein
MEEDMNEMELKMQIEAIMKKQDDVLENLSKARRDHARAKIDMSKKQSELTKIQDDLTQLHRVKSMAIIRRPEFSKDASMRLVPETGEPDPEWAQLVIDRYLHEDLEFIEVLGLYYEKQEAVRESGEVVIEAEAKELDFTDELGASKNQGLMLSTLMRMASP